MEATPATTGRPPTSAPEAEVGAPADRLRTWWASVDRAEVAVLVVAAVVGIALRWHVQRGPLGYVDLDEAAVGVQARRFFSHPATYFPGQTYGGTAEVALTAVAMRISSTALALKLVPTLLHAVTALVAWRAARRLVPARSGQLLVPVLLWVGPAFSVWESTKARGFYEASLLLAALAALLVLRADERPTPRRLLAFGVAAGVAAWTTPLLALVYVPCTAWLAVRHHRRWWSARWLLAGAAIGAAPALAWLARHGGDRVGGPQRADATPFELLTDGLAKVPSLLGLATPWDPDRTLLPGAALLTAAGLTIVLAVATLRTRRQAPGLLLGVLVGYVVGFGLVVPLGATGPDPRYLYPTLPFVALAIGSLLPHAQRPRGSALAVGAIGAVAALATLWGLQGMEAAAPSDPQFLSAPGIPEVTAHLEERGVERAITDVAGTQITFESDGRIRAASFAAPRFDDLQAVMFVEEPTTYVLEADRTANDESLERWARVHDIAYERRRFGTWVVYHVDEHLPPWEVGMATFGRQLTEERASAPLPGS